MSEKEDGEEEGVLCVRLPSSEPMTRIKHASVRFATALAANVLPVPGGPYSNTPLGGSIPNWTKRSGWSMGSSRTSRSFWISSLLPVCEGGGEGE